jgi:hypothetical protein
MDLGRHAGKKADDAIKTVAQLVDDLEERCVLQSYAASMVATTLVAMASEVARRETPTLKVDEEFVRAIMAALSGLVVKGVMLGEKRLAAARASD